MAESAANSAINLLGKILVEEGKYLWGAEGKIEDVRDELLWMQSFLKEADTIQYKDDTVRMWVSQIKDHVYEAEDIIEDFVINVASRRQKTGFLNKLQRYSCFFRELYDLHCAASSIDSLKVKISTLSPKLEKYGIKRSLGINTDKAQEALIEHVQQSLRYAHIEKKKIIGLEKDAQEIIAALKNKPSNRGFHAIYGMGGLGKTTLATKIFNSDAVKQYFSGGQAFTYISKQFQEESVLRDILESLKIGDINKLSKSGLVSKLQETLKNKKCLVVLDDVWTREAWDGLKSSFSSCGGDSGSKMLLTTRKEEVAKYVDPMALRKPDPLNNEESWELLQKTMGWDTTETSTNKRHGKSETEIIERNTDVSEKMKLGMEMMKVCKGLPLSVVVLGGILRRKQTLGEWRSVYNNINSYLKTGFDHGRSCTEIVLQSYNDLAYHLKACFLHLANYPEDHIIPTYQLYSMWVAEGLVTKSDDKKTMEDVANDYLTELAQDGLVEIVDKDVDKDEDGWIESIRMHDLVRDVCCEKATSDNLIEVIDLRTSPDTPSPSHYSGKRLLRMAIYLGEESENQVPPSSKAHKYIRSLVLFTTHKFDYHNEQIDTHKEWIKFICDEFQVLRVLVVEGLKSRERCGLTCLETLENLMVGNLAVEGLQKLRSLRRLTITDAVGDEAVLDMIQKGPAMKSGSLWSCVFKVKGGVISKLPSILSGMGVCKLQLTIYGQISAEVMHEIEFCRHLEHIELMDCVIEDDPMRTLGSLCHLKYLRLYDSYEGQKLSCYSGSFPRLRILHLEALRNLEVWVVDHGSMPNLVILHIWGCKLKRLPDVLPASLEYSRVSNEADDARITSSDKNFWETNAGLKWNMLRHCSSHILSAEILGGLLSLKDDLTEWETKHKELTGSTPLHFSQIFSICYADLPLHLRPCLIYLANFPEDAELSTKKLYQRWIAAGFVRSPKHPEFVRSKFDDQTNEDLESLASSYLTELKQRGMVTVWKRGKTCQLESALRDMCLEKAKEEHMLMIVNQFEHLASTSFANLKTQQLAVHLDKKSTASLDEQLYSLRLITPTTSLVIFSDINHPMHKENMWDWFLYICKDFQMLRVLDVEKIWTTKGRLPKEVGNLGQLRYLSLRRSWVSELPPSIGNLRELQTLDLRVMESIIIPDVLWKLNCLMHLYLPDDFFLPDDSDQETPKLQLHGLICLQTLANLHTDKVHLEHLRELKLLRKISFRKNHAVDDELHEIVRSADLEVSVNSEIISLDFISAVKEVSVNSGIINANPSILSSFQNLRKLKIKGRLSVQLYPEMFPTDLEELTLKQTKLEDDPLTILEKLPKLKSLFFLHESFLGSRMRIVSKEFYERATLTLCSLTNLEKLGLPVDHWDWMRLKLMGCLERIETIECSPEFFSSDGVPIKAVR